MQGFCNKILPAAEFLKKELLKKYELEHAEYLVQVEKIQKQAEEQRQRELEEEKKRNLEKLASGGGGGTGVGVPSSSSSSSPYPSSNYSDRAKTGQFLPSALGLATSQPGAPLQGSFVYGDTLADFKPSAPPPVGLGGPQIEPSTSGYGSTAGTNNTPSVDRSTKPTKPNRFLNPIETGIRPLTVPKDLAQTFLKYVRGNTAKNVETCGLITGKIVSFIGKLMWKVGLLIFDLSF